MNMPVGSERGGGWYGLTFFRLAGDSLAADGCRCCLGLALHYTSNQLGQ